MSKTPGRKPQNSSSRKRQLSSDAKIIVTLLKRQPQTKKELREETKISESAFYRNVFLLTEENIIKCEDGLYALWNFISLEKTVEDALIKLIRERKVAFQDSMVYEIGKPWSEIEAITLKKAKDLGLTMGRTEKGEMTFLDKKMLGLN